MSNILDLRLRGNFILMLTRGISYDSIEIDFRTQAPPDDLKINLTAWNGATNVEYTIGSGITISGTKAIWNVGIVNPPESSVVGKISTTNPLYGEAVNIDVNILVS